MSQAGHTSEKYPLYLHYRNARGLGHGQPTGWVSAQVVMVWHLGPGGAGPGGKRCEVQVRGLTAPGEPSLQGTRAVHPDTLPHTPGRGEACLGLVFIVLPKMGGSAHGGHTIPHSPDHVSHAHTQGPSQAK